MALTNAEHQRRFRQRRNELARRALALEAAAGEEAQPIPPLPVKHQARAARGIALELVQLKSERRKAKSRGDAAGLADAEAAIEAWEAVKARLLPA